MKNTIRWGVLGCAKIALQKVIPAIQHCTNGKVVAIASRSDEKVKDAAEKLNIARSYSSYEALLSDPEIDAVYIPLPNHLHIPWTVKAMQAGKHVLCEKPLGIDAGEVRQFITETEKFPHLKVMEAFMYRFHPQWLKAFELVKSGAIGETKTINSFFSYCNIDPLNIRNKIEAAGGALMDIGCYCVSFSRFLFNNEPVRIVSSVDRDPVMKVDRLTSAIIEFPEGKSSTFTCSTQIMPYQRVHVLGSAGHLEIEIPVNVPKDVASKVWVRTSDGTEEFIVDPVDQYTLQAEAFAQAILDDKPAPIKLQDAEGNMAAIDAIFKSARNKSWVSLE